MLDSWNLFFIYPNWYNVIDKCEAGYLPNQCNNDNSLHLLSTITGYYSKYFTYIISYLVPTTTLCNRYYFQFNRWENQDTERVSDLRRVLELISSGDRIPTQANWLQSLNSSPLCNNQTQWNTGVIPYSIKRGYVQREKRKNTERNQPINFQHALIIKYHAEPL